MADTWESLQAMTSARFGATSGVIDGVLYVAGGVVGINDSDLNESYDPAAPTLWTPRQVQPLGGRRAAAVGDPVVDRKLYAVGGVIAAASTATGDRYDPDTNLWTPIALLPSARTSMGAVAHGGSLYVIGGRAGTTIVSDLLRYDPGPNTYTPLAPMPTARMDVAAAVIGDFIFVAGGRIANNNLAGSIIATLERYDIINDDWTPPAPLPDMGTSRYAASVGVVDGQMFVAGGRVAGTGNGTDVHESYDPATNLWTPRAVIPLAGRGSSGYGVIGGQYLHVAGGWASSAGSTTHQRYVAVDVEGWLLGLRFGGA